MRPISSMYHPITPALLAFILLAGTAVPNSGGAEAPAPLQKVAPPPPGKLYHAVYPGGITGDEDDIALTDLQTYTGLAGHDVAWVYFSNNWFKSRAFPVEMATWIRNAGAVPYIRLMLRHTTDQNKPPREFRLQNIIDGKLDEDLTKWADAARDFGTPLLAEYGTEMNGRWFPWNGIWNGANRKKGFGSRDVADGPERFIAAYRHIVELVRSRGASNVSWVFHANADDDPEARWNQLERYYPGDDVVDWLGLSAYGYQTPMARYPRETFRELVDRVYPRLAALSSEKPIMVLEFGHTAGNPRQDAATWANEAFTDLFSGRWPRIAGFSWWNERWENDEKARHDTTMRLQDIPALSAVFQQQLDTHADALQESPVFMPAE
jgi:hypothetical protein